MFGSVVCATGDADGDGVPDLIVADPCYEEAHESARAWLVSGKTMRVLFERTIYGGNTLVDLSIRGLADVNGDGTPDWLLSPWWSNADFDPNPSVVSGIGGGFLRELDPTRPELQLSDRSGRALHAPYFPSGPVRLDVDDFDGDGVRDYAVRDQERVALLSGKDGRHLRVIGPPATEMPSNFGGAIAGMGDVDGDGLCDIAIASPDWGVGEGRVQVLSIASGRCLYTVEADGAGWHWGRRLAALGDIDGDGISDLAVASWHARSHEPGRARVVSGKNGKTLVTFLRDGKSLSIRCRAGTWPSNAAPGPAPK
jgi:FG-GAP-like repeat